MTYQYGFEHHGFNNLRNRSFWRVLHDPALWKLLGPFVEKHGLVLWSTLFYAWETNTCRGAMSSANYFGFEHGIYVDNRAKTEQELVLRKWEVLHDVVGWVTHEETQVFWSRVTGEDIFGYEYKASKERSQKESRVTLFLAWRFFFLVLVRSNDVWVRWLVGIYIMLAWWGTCVWVSIEVRWHFIGASSFWWVKGFKVGGSKKRRPLWGSVGRTGWRMWLFLYI